MLPIGVSNNCCALILEWSKSLLGSPWFSPAYILCHLHLLRN